MNESNIKIVDSKKITDIIISFNWGFCAVAPPHPLNQCSHIKSTQFNWKFHQVLTLHFHHQQQIATSQKNKLLLERDLYIVRENKVRTMVQVFGSPFFIPNQNTWNENKSIKYVGHFDQLMWCRTESVGVEHEAGVRSLFSLFILCVRFLLPAECVWMWFLNWIEGKSGQKKCAVSRTRSWTKHRTKARENCQNIL